VAGEFTRRRRSRQRGVIVRDWFLPATPFNLVAMTEPSTLPRWDVRRALFLDVDGTLLEIMRHPDDVWAGPRLKRLLEAASESLGGALALVSGRSLASLDRIFAPLCFPAAGLHGLERRDARGQVHYPSGYADRLAVARHRLKDFVQSERGLRLEDKGSALALHYRDVPELEAECRRRMELAREATGEDFHIQQGKMVFELKPSGKNKGTAVAAFMQEPPFQGRQPVFIGDDVTDEDGFRTVNNMGGLSIRVGAAPGSAARLVAADVSEILAWLALGLGHDDVRAS
jgi:trehalose 6-phosphate phosphatase